MTTKFIHQAAKTILKLRAALCVSLLALGSAHAAEVVFEDVRFISGIDGVGGTNSRFTVPQHGIYQAQLVDFVFPVRFDSLGLSIMQGATTELNHQISTSGGFSFTFEADPGLHYANVVGDAGGPLNIGLYGLKISLVSAVPLPNALALFITALVILVFFADKGRAWKNNLLNGFKKRWSWTPGQASVPAIVDC